MEKEFAPLELSVKMKNIGFNKPCLACYLDEKFVVKLQSQNSEFEYFNNTTFTISDRAVSAPLWQQAFDWFREEYNLEYYPSPVYDKWNNPDKICGFGIEIYNVVSGEFEFNYNDGILSPYYNYEEAKIIGIKKLIEIATNISKTTS